ncbi:threonine/homoserine efflux transporter RhtA [Mumia flava]|uniref:Threonine/homoserine efflux transporter RhtA n=2 Tax=Mumia flava TaxID=1348852 RepID=A0A2M9BF76_9ACTN|nr:threonine/homoserine efflux transporter RhtA [Mumia flava]
MAHDAAAAGATAAGPRTASGLGFALTSALAFGLSGPIASPLFDAGWSTGAVTLLRIGLGAVVVVPFGLVALRGRWGVLRRNARLVVLYGLLAVVGAQFCYFAAIQRMQVGPALLIEYTAPVAVVVWFWLRHGQRPGPVTLVGALLAALGLFFVLDLLGGATLDPIGVLWALGAMVGAATYFVINGDLDNGLPPLALAAGGLLVGATGLGSLALVGLLPMTATTAPVGLAGATVPWWLPVALLGAVTAGVAYVSGIAAGRRLGSRLSSFVALLEVVAAVLFAWLLLDELPRAVQLLGGVLILAGVVAVRLGEERTAAVVASAVPVGDSEPSTRPPHAGECEGAPPGAV